MAILISFLKDLLIQKSNLKKKMSYFSHLDSRSLETRQVYYLLYSDWFKEKESVHFIE